MIVGKCNEHGSNKCWGVAAADWSNWQHFTAKETSVKIAIFHSLSSLAAAASSRDASTSGSPFLLLPRNDIQKWNEIAFVVYLVLFM